MAGAHSLVRSANIAPDGLRLVNRMVRKGGVMTLAEHHQLGMSPWGIVLLPLALFYVALLLGVSAIAAAVLGMRQCRRICIRLFQSFNNEFTTSFEATAKGADQPNRNCITNQLVGMD
jgi:hypothetical protein